MYVFCPPKKCWIFMHSHIQLMANLVLLPSNSDFSAPLVSMNIEHHPAVGRVHHQTAQLSGSPPSCCLASAPWPTLSMS